MLGFGAAERIIGWGGSLDFLITRWSDPGWVGAILGAIAAQTGYISFVFIMAGAAFILWNERRRTERLLEARVGTSVPSAAAKPESDTAAMNRVITEVYATFGRVVGSEERLQYDIALADWEHVMLAISQDLNMPIPELRRDGTPAGVYRMLAFLNEIIPALRIDDVDEARRRAEIIVPQLNEKNADDLHEEMGLPRYSMPPS